MSNITAKANNKRVTSTISAIMLATVMSAASGEVRAYDLQANTIYASTKDEIYRVELNGAATTATKVADSNASLSGIQDVAFDGSVMYGANLHMQLLKLEPSADVTQPINEAASYSLQYQGLEARNGVLYGAELRSLVIIDKATGNPVSGNGIGGYGLGAGELVTDLAFAEDGTLYASVNFEGIPYSYLGTLDTNTGELMLLGNTGVEYILAITVKDGLLYAMDRQGSLYSLNDVSGYATIVAEQVLPGVSGLDTSPAQVSAGATTAGTGATDNDTDTGGGSGGSLSAVLLILVSITSLMRRIR